MVLKLLIIMTWNHESIDRVIIVLKNICKDYLALFQR